MNIRMNQKIRLMAFVGCAVASGLPAWANNYYWDVGAAYENVFQPSEKATSNWRNADSSTARTAVPPGSGDTIVRFASGTYTIPVLDDVSTNMRFGQNTPSKASSVTFDLQQHTWTCPTVFWIGGENAEVDEGFNTDIRMTNGNFTVEQNYSSSVKGFALCGGNKATSGSVRFSFAGPGSKMTLPGQLEIDGSSANPNISRFAVESGAELTLGGLINFNATFGSQFYALSGAKVTASGSLYVRGNNCELLVGPNADVHLSHIEYYQYATLTNNTFTIDGGTLTLDDASKASSISRGNSNNQAASIVDDCHNALYVKNGGVLECPNALWVCWSERGAKAEISDNATVRAVDFGSNGLGINGYYSVSNATLELQGSLRIGNGSTGASTNYATNHTLRVAGTKALVSAASWCSKFASTVRFDIPSAGYVDGEGHARAPIQVSGGWMSADTYTADKLGQKLDRIVVAAKSFDSAHPGESVVLMTFGTPDDKQVKAWADVALANAVFETGGREAGTLAMNADYTKLIYTAPKVKHKGLILLVL